MKTPLSPFTTSILLSITIVLFVGCSNDTTNPQPKNAEVITKSNMYPDSTAGWLYYSIDGDSVVPPSDSATTKWDIKFAFLPGASTRQIDILLNSGTVGSGNTLGAVVNSRFENLVNVPDQGQLRSDDTASANRIIPIAVVGEDAVFVYSGPPNYTISPSPEKVIFIKTNLGALVKFQVTSIYLNAPPSPTFTDPLGYYHFRYSKTTSTKW